MFNNLIEIAITKPQVIIMWLVLAIILTALLLYPFTPNPNDTTVKPRTKYHQMMFKLTGFLVAATITTILAYSPLFAVHKKLETTTTKQIYSNKNQIAITINGKEPQDIHHNDLFNNYLGTDLKLLKDEYRDLEITAKNKNDTLTQEYQLDFDDIKNPTNNPRATITKVEIYNKRYEKITLNKREIIEIPHVKLIFDSNEDYNELKYFLTP